MKRTLLLTAVAAMGLLLAACEVDPDDAEPPPPPPGVDTPTPPDDDATARGQAIFTGTEPAAAPFCTACHTVGQGDQTGPDLQGVATRAAERVPQLSAEEYLRQAVTAPEEFVVPGFPQGVMPDNYGEQFTEEQLDALIAYLMTLE